MTFPRYLLARYPQEEFRPALVVGIAVEFPRLDAFRRPVIPVFIGVRLGEYFGVFPREDDGKAISAVEQAIALHQVRIGSTAAAARNPGDPFVREADRVDNQRIALPVPN